MTTNSEDIKDKLDALAMDIAETAMAVNPDRPLLFGEKLDAFKALTAYHLGVAKVNKKKSGEDDKPEQGENFDGFRKSVEASGE